MRANIITFAPAVWVAALMLAMLPCVKAETDPELDHTLDVALAIVDAVIERHFDPPAREQMLLDGARALYQRAERPIPSGLSHRVSGLRREDEREFLLNVWKEVRASAPESVDLDQALFAGLLSPVRGDAHFAGTKESKVQEQVQGNRYVGIGVTLGLRSNDRGPTINPFPQGVAHQAGIRENDQILEVDGVSTKDKKLTEVVDLLRGPEGTTVRLLIHRPKEADPLTFSLRRSVVRFETVRGYRQSHDLVWDYRVEGAEGIAYVQIPEIRGSTLHELRQAEQRLKSPSIRGLILDLRFNSGGNFHDVLLLADGLLPEAKMGRAHSSSGEVEYSSRPECLLRDAALMVLINSETTHEAEWLAAALKSGRKAVLVGAPTAGEGYAIEPVTLPNGLGVLRLWTKVLYTAEGRNLLSPNAELFKRGFPGHQMAMHAVGGRLRDSKVNKIGVPADVEVGVPKGSLASWFEPRGTDPFAGYRTPPTPPNDPQYNEALRILMKTAAGSQD